MVAQAANLGILESRVIPEISGQEQINQDVLAVFMKMAADYVKNGGKIRVNMEPILNAVT